MLLSGTVVADSQTVIEDGSVVTDGNEIAFVGDRATALDRYPDHERRAFDIVAPGLVGAHVHSVQSLGRGIADDAPLLEWLFDHVLPLEERMDREAMATAAKLGYLECLESGITVALGNDGPPCNNTLDPFTEMRQGSLLAKVDNNDATALPAATIFEMATLGGARAAGFENVGALREGWRADVIGLSTTAARSVPVHDPLSALVYATHGDDVTFTMVDVTFTMVDGAVLQDGGQIRCCDAATVRRRAQRLATE